jgi:hypothetical protein
MSRARAAAALPEKAPRLGRTSWGRGVMVEVLSMGPPIESAAHSELYNCTPSRARLHVCGWPSSSTAYLGSDAGGSDYPAATLIRATELLKKFANHNAPSGPVTIG